MKVRDSITFSKIGEEGVLFDSESGNFFSLNEVAVRIVEILQKNNNADENVILIKLKEEYETDEHELMRDIKAFLQEMKRENILV